MKEVLVCNKRSRQTLIIFWSALNSRFILFMVRFMSILWEGGGGGGGLLDPQNLLNDLTVKCVVRNYYLAYTYPCIPAQNLGTNLNTMLGYNILRDLQG